MAGSFLRKLFFSLFLMLLIPCFILFLLYSGFLSKTISERIGQVVENEQRSAAHLLDADIQQLEEAFDFFRRCEGFQSYVSTHRFLTDKDGKIASLQILSDVVYIYRLQQQVDYFFVWLADANTVLSVNGMYHSDAFFERNFSDGDETPEALKQYYLSLEKPALDYRKHLTLHGEEDEYLTFAYPLIDSKGSFGAAVFCVKPEPLAAYFSAHNDDLSAGIVFLDKEGQYLFSSNVEPELLKLCLEDTSAFSHNNAPVTLGRLSYRAITTESAATGWKVITLVPQKAALQSSFFPMRQFLIIYLMLCAFFGTFMLVVLTKLNYAPIRNLKMAASAVVGKPKEETLPATKGDIQEIANALDYLHTENQNLKKVYKDKMQDIQNNRLLRFLNDFYPSLEEFNNDCEQIGLTFSYNTFLVSTFLFIDPSCSPKHPITKQSVIFMLAEKIKGILNAACENRYVFSLQKDQLIFVHSIPKEDTEISGPLEEVMQMLLRDYGLTCCIGISSCHAGTVSLGEAVLEAVKALEYRFVRGEGIIYYQEIPQHQDLDYSYPSHELERLKEAVQSGDRTRISATLDLLAHHISDSGTPAFVARCICFDIAKTLYPIPDDNYPLTQTLLFLNETESVETFLDVIMDLNESLADAGKKEAAPAQGEEQLFSEIMNYIWINYTRCDFSVQEIADSFRLSPSALSCLFKAKMSLSLQEYLIWLRMEKAKELLKNTRLSLKDVALQVGYYNVSSFIRRFKAQEGFTPNAYRFHP